MIISRNELPYNNTIITIQNRKFERVTQYKYLGLHSDWNSDKEIRGRIEMAGNS